MHLVRRPEAIASRFVFRTYARIAIAGGAGAVAWGPVLLSTLHLQGLPFGRAAILRLSAGVVIAFGMCAVGFSQVREPGVSRRCLIWFAFAHIVFGTLFFVQWWAILVQAVPAATGWATVVPWAGLVVGIVLLYVGITGPGSGSRRMSLTVGDDDGKIRHDVALMSRPSVEELQSQYEEQIRQAVRQEERARLARDLHDAVKQQLFVIQTAAATAQTRFDSDPAGARGALEQVRSAVRQAMTEMQVMLDQLQAAPLENAGLAAALRQHCEALGFRTGAEVTFELGELPPEQVVSPGAREAVLRVAQEALANVARHARAGRVHVSLGTNRTDLVLTVRDDGSGFEPGEHPQGMGVANMAARAREVGGLFDLRSVPGRGTALRFAVPCGNRPARDYAIRAGLWTLVFAAAILLPSSGSAAAVPWLVAGASIAAIAALRYAVAWHRVRRAGRRL